MRRAYLYVWERACYRYGPDKSAAWPIPSVDGIASGLG